MERPNDKYLSLNSLAEYADLPVPTLRDYIKGCGLPCFKVKGKLLVRQSEFDEWMEGFRVKSQDALKDIVDDVMQTLKSDNSTKGQGG